jgi:serine/threonine-protein kinase
MSTLDRLTAALADRYRIDRELGAGGMATVYLAHDLRHERDVAIKVLHPDLGAALGAERFLSEIKTTAKLQHPHILPLLDSGAADGLLFYVMPFVDGETLRARLERETQLAIADAVRIAREVADALQYAHARGVVHRDIKPENILLQDGHALVADFGIALAVQQAGGQRMTQTGLSLGTPQYMSPEQATGEKSIDARSDVYALGAVTYEMLVGEPPFTGPSTQAIVARLLSAPPASLRATRSTIPAHIDATVLTALAKLPADRQATAAEFAAQLGGLAAITPPTASASSTMSATDGRTPGGGWPRRTRWVIAALALATATSTGTLGWIASRPAPRSVTRTFVLQLPDSALLANSNVEWRVALSRDGRRLYYTGTAGRRRALYARDAEDTLPHLLPGTEGGGAPVTCPDGKWLYFSRANSTSAARLSLQGAPLVNTVLDQALVRDCSERGSILFTRDRALWLLEEGRQPRRIVGPDSSHGELAIVAATFLPGGESAVMSVSRGNDAGTGRIDVVSLRDGARRQLPIEGRGPQYTNGHLLYAEDGRLQAVPFDARAQKVTGSPATLATGVAFRRNGIDVAVSDEGTMVFVSGALGGLFRLVRVDAAGREQALDREPYRYGFPRISPDGERVAVEVGTGRGEWDVWLLTVAGQSLDRLTTNASAIRPAGWSTDGKRIAQLVLERQTSLRSLRRPAWVTWDQSAPPALFDLSIPDGHTLEDISISTDTNVLAVRTNGPGGRLGDVWVAHRPATASGASWPLIPIAATDADEVHPRLSPNGRWIAYASNESGNYQIYVRSASGTGGRVPVSMGVGTEPVWEPGGHAIFFRGETRLMRAELKEGATLEVTRRDSLFVDSYRRDASSVQYDVFPDGRSWLMQKAIGAVGRQPVMVLNWPELLSRSGKP